MNEPRSTRQEAARERRVALGWVAAQLRWERRLDGLRGTDRPSVPTARADADDAIDALVAEQAGLGKSAPEVEPAA